MFMLKDPNLRGAHLFLAVGLRNATVLPESMVLRGVHKLELRVLQMWRPHCLDVLSSSLASRKANASAMPILIARMAERNMHLRRAGCAVLVVSYADLLWRPRRTISRIEDFLPCGVQLRRDFVPKLGRDVYPGNKWKMNFTRVQFAKSHPAQSLGYNLTTSSCNLPGRPSQSRASLAAAASDPKGFEHVFSDPARYMLTLS